MQKQNISRTLKLAKTGQYDIYFYLFSFFIFVFVYFVSIGDYILYFQEQQSLFVFSTDYINEFFLKPGGPLELTGKFLTQFYSNAFTGSVILSTILTLNGLLLVRINRQLDFFNTLSILIVIIPICILMLLQTHYYHLMEYNLGFLMTLSFFLFSIHFQTRKSRFFTISIFPLIYYIIGTYAFLYIGILIVHLLICEKGIYKYVFSVASLIIVTISVLVFYEFLFLQPLDQLIFFPIPFFEDQKNKILLYFLSFIIVSYPLYSKLFRSCKIQKIDLRISAITLFLLLLTATTFLIYKFYNPQTARVVRIEKLAFEEKWDDLIRMHERYPSQNLIGQYFYNVALSETDQLCQRLFMGNQDFNANSLILSWRNEHLKCGSYFYYSVGLMNEAHRWAYEDMVVYGMRPQNLTMLVKTNLINQNFQMARKYIGKLKKTYNYRKWAIDYEKLINDQTSMKYYPEILAKRKILPINDFFLHIDSPQNNIPQLLNSNPLNRKAFEYEMAWLMLTKDVESVASRIPKMKELGYTQIPRHVEEAALIYLNIKGTLPNLGGLTISNQTTVNFNKYVSAFKTARQSSSLGTDKMLESFSKTFMYYYHFR